MARMMGFHRGLVVSIALGVALLAGAASVAHAEGGDAGLAPIGPSGISIGLSKVSGGFVAPSAAAVAPGVASSVFVADQVGKIYAIDVTKNNAQPRQFADLSSLVGGSLGCYDWNYDERGLVGLAFDPNYATNGLLYTYIATAQNGCDVIGWTPSNLPNHQNRLIEWHVKSPGSQNATVDSKSARVVMQFDNPFYDHSGGTLRFGPDGDLYVAVGDGGSEDGENPMVAECNRHGCTPPAFCTLQVCLDQGQSLGGNAQDLSKLNGKILRIDPHASGQDAYSVPADNPFVGTAGARPEIWAYGLRNPFAFSFTSGGLVAGDVGQDNVEELDNIAPGANYGWPLKEGTFTFHNGDDITPTASNDAFGGFLGTDGFVTAADNSPGVPSNLTDPFFEYDHSQGITIMAGFDYGGTAVPQLAGKYVFGDYAANDTGAFGRLFVRNQNGSVGELGVSKGALGVDIRGFIKDAGGELFVYGNPDGGVSGRQGVVLRITAG